MNAISLFAPRCSGRKARPSRPILALFGMALAGSTALVATVPAHAQPVVTIGSATGPTSLDPHYQNVLANNALFLALYSRLVERTSTGSLMPGLALEWKPVGDATWEFKLREGVKWHDGTPFTAEDIAFTLERIPNVPNSPSRYSSYINSIERLEIVSPTVIRIHTKGPSPFLPADLSLISIGSSARKGATTDEFNSGAAAIGTGPYKFKAFVPKERVELEKNADWWGWATQTGPDRIVLKVITNGAARVSALLAGDVDVIDNVPSNDLDRLSSNPNFAVAQIAGSRSVFLVPNFGLAAGNPYITSLDDKPLPENPLLKLEVRKALSTAIDRNAISQRLMRGAVTATGQILSEGTDDYDATIPVPPHDIAEAKRLLASAGYPNGFKLKLFVPADLTSYDPTIAQAIAQGWTRAGIATSVEALPNVVYTKQLSRQEFSIGRWDWGNSTGPAKDALVNVFVTFDAKKGLGASNVGRYSNPVVDEATIAATKTVDGAERQVLLKKAVKAVVDDLGMIPLYHPTGYWLSKKDISFIPRKDGWTSPVSVLKPKS